MRWKDLFIKEIILLPLCCRCSINVLKEPSRYCAAFNGCLAISFGGGGGGCKNSIVCVLHVCELHTGKISI